MRIVAIGTLNVMVLRRFMHAFSKPLFPMTGCAQLTLGDLEQCGVAGRMRIVTGQAGGYGHRAMHEGALDKIFMAVEAKLFFTVGYKPAFPGFFMALATPLFVLVCRMFGLLAHCGVFVRPELFRVVQGGNFDLRVFFTDLLGRRGIRHPVEDRRKDFVAGHLVATAEKTEDAGANKRDRGFGHHRAPGQWFSLAGSLLVRVSSSMAAVFSIPVIWPRP
ncbi:MAG: hypothetical protein WDA20_06145 [Desulfuromonadales bacterium]